MNPNMPTGETLSEGSPFPPELAAEELPQNETFRIPVAALATPDEKEKMVNPEAGDKVMAQVELEVVSVDAESATVKLTSVNGEPVGGDMPPTPASPDMDSLTSQAESMGTL